MKVMTVVGTRPEVIKLSRVIDELDRHVEHVLVHTGQNHDYELSQVFFEQLRIHRPHYFLEAADSSLAAAIGKIIARSDEVMAREQPDALLVLGDTNSCLCVIPAKRRKIPIFHMEAGNRCFDQRVPEETNRRIVDHVSDMNLVYTDHARGYLIREGIKPETILKTGSPMKEVLDHYSEEIEASTALQGLGVEPGEYFVASAHREENVDEEHRLRLLLDALAALAAQHDKPVLISTHPRTAKRLSALGGRGDESRLRFLKPLGFFDYVKLQQQSACVLSDSGTLTEESSLLGFPAVMLRESHERPEGMDEGTVVMAGLQTDVVLAAVAMVMSQRSTRQRVVRDYNVDKVSTKVTRAILSYTHYVNRTVWMKPGGR